MSTDTRTCTSCDRAMRERRDYQPGMDMVVHAAHNVCATCYRAWRRHGKPCPITQFRHTPARGSRRRSYPYTCRGCGEVMTHGMNGRTKSDGLAMCANDMCSACYQAWRRAGKPDTFTRKASK